jgi:hypothetical protein
MGLTWVCMGMWVLTWVYMVLTWVYNVMGFNVGIQHGYPEYTWTNLAWVPVSIHGLIWVYVNISIRGYYIPNPNLIITLTLFLTLSLP